MFLRASDPLVTVYQSVLYNWRALRGTRKIVGGGFGIADGKPLTNLAYAGDLRADFLDRSPDPFRSLMYHARTCVRLIKNTSYSVDSNLIPDFSTLKVRGICCCQAYMLVTSNMVFKLQAWCLKRGMIFDDCVSELAVRASEAAGEHMTNSITSLSALCRIVFLQNEFSR